MKLRLHQFLARSGVAKNNFEIAQMIKKRRVRVDNEVVTAESFVFDTKRRRVFLDGEEINLQPTRYFVVNKPKGHSCQRGEYPNVTDLLDNILRNEPKAMRSLFVVGRLDRETEGLLIVTNDGKMASQILQPVEKVEKEYEAYVEGGLTDKDMQTLETGVTIVVDGEDYKTAPAKLKLIKRIKIPSSGKVTSIVQIIITEGKKRQVRQMFEKVNHPVIALKRVRIGALKISDIGERWVMELSRNDILRALE
ncbi:MAG: rRNA pseudouridine synthase [Deltaproteobacteria bacterium]|nr:rRNA pseudouridine synthase [Deltaproteobacteria bacterium]